MNRIFILLMLLGIRLNGQPTEATGTIYVSHDLGSSWSRSDIGFPAKEVVNAWVIKDGLILAGTDSHGVIISSDKGKSWSGSRKGLPQAARVTALFGDSEVVFAGTFQHGIYMSANDGLSWQPYNLGINNLTIRAFHANGGAIYAGTNDGVYVLAKTSGKWVKVGGEYQVNDFASDGQFVYAATHLGVVRTPDGGLHWEKVYWAGSVFKIAIEMHQICLLDHAENVHYANARQLVWFKDETYMPVRHSYRLTPTSRKILLPASGIHNIMINTPVLGLPANAPFSNFLQTPFGLFTSVVTREGC